MVDTMQNIWCKHGNVHQLCDITGPCGESLRDREQTEIDILFRKRDKIIIDYFSKKI